MRGVLEGSRNLRRRGERKRIESARGRRRSREGRRWMRDRNRNKVLLLRRELRVGREVVVVRLNSRRRRRRGKKREMWTRW